MDDSSFVEQAIRGAKHRELIETKIEALGAAMPLLRQASQRLARQGRQLFQRVGLVHGHEDEKEIWALGGMQRRNTVSRIRIGGHLDPADKGLLAEAGHDLDWSARSTGL
jgi:hypothetical protein